MTARILVIEDDPALLTILEAAIAYGGFTSHAKGPTFSAAAASTRCSSISAFPTSTAASC
jgi:hypothetical protein